jgi:hypothetical protein
MSYRSDRSLVVGLCALACAAAAVSWWPRGHDVRTEDQNRDGRPDVWRVYDPQGQLATMAVDTNFDGRSDVREYYERGALVRRESDRDFNDRVDLVQEFDATTRQAVRAVSDVDFDGVADLLVLFEGGRPVYSKWAPEPTPVPLSGVSARAAAASPRRTAHQLVPLEDPFRFDLAVSAIRRGGGLGDHVGLATSGGLPESCGNGAAPLASSSDVLHVSAANASSATVLHQSPRGPPLSHRLT